jgi:hypothetical protein
MLVYWYTGSMKTTLDLPDDLVREIKLRAVHEDKKLKELITELLRRGLAAAEQQPQVRNRVHFPLIRTTHPATPDTEITPERMKEILLDLDVQEHLAKT